MSETTDNKGQAVLLPSASVSVFSRDDETLSSAKALAEDWRFARVDVDAHEGDVASATDHFKSNGSTDLVIIQTETIDDNLPDQLEALAMHCDEGTAAIVIGPVNDVALYRKLIDMGISDYLVKPVSTEELANVISKTLIERLGVKDSRLIVTIGAKGGVGATVLTEAMAWGVSDILQQKTILLDGAAGWSTLSVGMGFEPVATMNEAVKAAAADDEESLERMLYKADDRLHVLATGSDVMLDPSVSADGVEKLVDMLMVKYPVVLADLSHTASELEKALIARANQVVLVSTPALSSLRLARSLAQEIKDIRGGDDTHLDLIVNMQGLDTANEVPKADIEQAMEMQVSAFVPYNTKVFLKAENEGQKLSNDAAGKEITTKALLPVLQKYLKTTPIDDTSETEEKSGFFARLFKSS